MSNPALSLRLLSQKVDLLNELLTKARWKGKDVFGYHPIWNDHHRKLLQVADRHGQLEYYLKRLRKGQLKQRRATFAELAAAYFLEDKVGGKIVRWFPGDGRGEFIVSINSVSIFCEVKCPGWEGEVVEQEGSNPLPARLGKPKHLAGESFAYETSRIIWEIIEKARDKFPNDMPGLVIFADDFRIPSVDDPISVHRALYGSSSKGGVTTPGYFLDPNSKWLAGVAFLNYDFPCPLDKVRCRFRFCVNPQCPQERPIRRIFGPWIDLNFQATGWWKGNAS